jgi:hypothetical protein
VFLHQELRYVAPHRQTEALERQHWIHGLMAAHPGFQRALACRFPGAIDRYAWFRFWDDAAANLSFRQSPAANYNANRPEGLYEPLANAIGGAGRWELALQTGDGATGDYLVRSVFQVSAGRDADFLESRRRHDDLALATAGVESISTFRCLEDNAAGSYIALTGGSGREAYNTFLESSDAAKYHASVPAGLYETLAVECYDIMHEVLPG